MGSRLLKGRQTDVTNQRDPCCRVWMQHWLRSKGGRKGVKERCRVVVYLAAPGAPTVSPRLMDRTVDRTKHQFCPAFAFIPSLTSSSLLPFPPLSHSLSLSHSPTDAAPGPLLSSPLSSLVSTRHL